MSKTFYVTTPIYYPSDVLHIGHVYSTTLAWTLRNYKKLLGYKTKLVTGADEHGQKIALVAQHLNLKPQLYVDKMAQKFQELWQAYKIDYDYFSRTSDLKHKKMVTKIFDQLLSSKNIYLDYYSGLYSISDEEFFTKAQAKIIDGNYVHPVSNHPLINIKEASFFLKIKEHEKWLNQYFQDHPKMIVPHKVLNELNNNFLKPGLNDLSITRSTFDWGISVPGHHPHVIYVWLDALTNYLSALGYQTKNNHDYIQFWKNGDEIVHVIGKEISRFHAIYWPIMLHALNLRQPNTILAHGWLVTTEGKMSKSKGNVIDPLKLLKKFHPEAIKYYLMSQINTGQDGVLSEELLLNVYNADLVNNVGNLLSRTAKLAEHYFPKGLKTLETFDQDISHVIKSSWENYQMHFNQFEIADALKVAINLAKQLNIFIEKTSPWNLTTKLNELNNILHVLCNGIYAVAIMLSVVLPLKMNEMLKSLGLKTFDIKQINKCDKFNNVKVKKYASLFERIKK